MLDLLVACYVNIVIEKSEGDLPPDVNSIFLSLICDEHNNDWKKFLYQFGFSLLIIEVQISPVIMQSWSKYFVCLLNLFFKL